MAHLATGVFQNLMRLEIVVAVGLAAVVGEQRVALAGGGNGRQRAEPGGDVALHLRLPANVRATYRRSSGCGALAAIMVVSAQPVAPSSGTVEAIGFLSACSRLT